MNNPPKNQTTTVTLVSRTHALLCALCLLCLPQHVLAHSGIFNINGWSPERLKEVGITIREWKHDKDSDLRDFPEMTWVEITYDWKRMGEDRHVEMTLYTSTDDGEPTAACRTEHRKGQSDPMKLLFTVPEKNRQNCHVWILFPGSIKDAKNDADPKVLGMGDGPQGYSLDLSRIFQLATESAEGTAHDKGDAGETPTENTHQQDTAQPVPGFPPKP